MQERIHLPVLGLIVAIGVIISTYMVTDVIRDVRLSHQIIKVRGYAEKAVVSDLAVWMIQLQIRAESAREGYPVIEEQKNHVLEFLKNHGIERDNIRVFSVSIREVKKLNEAGHEVNKIDHIALKQVFRVTSRDVRKVEVLSNKITELIGQGIGIRSSSVDYHYRKVNEIKSELLTAATKDARTRAATLAEGSGVELGFLRAARQGRFSVRSADTTSVSSDPSSFDDTDSINKKITAVVTVDYSMK